MGIRLNCLNRSSGELTIDFRLIINIMILKFTIYRLYQNAVKIEKTQRVSSLRSLLPDEQLLWQLNLQDGHLLWQLNEIRSMVTLENMRCCTARSRCSHWDRMEDLLHSEEKIVSAACRKLGIL